MNPAFDRSAHPITLLWQPATLLSTFAAGELLAIILVLGSPIATGSILVKFGLASFAVQWVVLFTLGCLYLLRRKLAGVRTHGLVALAMALMLAVTLLSGAGANSLFGTLLADSNMPWFLTAMRFYACLLAMLLFGLLALRSHWDAQRAAYQAKQAELQVLQARVDPHFLFNTLNTGISLVHARPDAAEQLLLDLSDLFRAALAGPRMIPLADELGLAMRYLDIEQLRFGERLNVEWSVPHDLPEVVVPALSVQPLVENAIHHGIEPRIDGGTLRVAARIEGGTVMVEVSNPLPPADAQIRRRGHHVGQAGVGARIAEATNGAGRLHTQVEDGRYLARLEFPLG